MIILLKGP